MRTPPTLSDLQHHEHQQWLMELTAIPTAAGREERVIAWVRNWVKRRRNLQLHQDPAGNLLITMTPRSTARKKKATTGGKSRRAHPIFVTAHLDHPAFVVRGEAIDRIVELEFRGGVHDPYFDNAVIDIFDAQDRRHRARVLTLDSSAKPFKRAVAQLQQATNSIVQGDVGRWAFADTGPLPRLVDGLVHAPACDDLAAVAAALSMLEILRTRQDSAHVGVLLTRAEEIGFLGAIAACKHKSIPKAARLICLENSRSFDDSPLGAGPIVRVGDKMSVFEPALTNRISMLMMEHQKTVPDFKWQRKLMPGGTCEATAFSALGYESTCLCLALGNYHNMVDIDAVLAGKRPATVGPEFISIDDYHGLIQMLVLCALQLDSLEASGLKTRMEQLWRDHRDVLEESNQ